MSWLWRREPMLWLLFLALAGAGALAATRLPSGIYPEVEFPRIVVVARAGDGPPELVELELTRPLEGALATVLGVERLHARTIRGTTELALQFAPGTDMERALQHVQAAVAEARTELPRDVEVSVERLTTVSFPVVTFNLGGPATPDEARLLREVAELQIRPAFARVPGVGHVEAMGGDVREVEILVEPARAAALGLTPYEVAELVKKQALVRAVGRFDESHAQVTVMLASEPQTLAELRALPVALGADGSPVLLGDVATVVEGAEDRTLSVAGPRPETVQIGVSRLPGASTPEVVDAVLAAGAALGPGLPDGVTLTPVYDQSELVDLSIASVRDAILIGVLLCVAVIALFLRDLRAGAAAALAVPLALGATFIPMAAFGQSLNLMSLGGLAVAIGLVIDDAIVVVEGIGARVEAGEDPRTAAVGATRALLGPLVGTTVTTVVVFVPLAWLEGVVGRFFSALAATLSTAVLLSLAVSLTVVPLAAGRWLRPRAHAAREPILARAYARVMRPFLARPLLGVALGVALLGAGVFGALHVGSGFLPTMDEGAFVLDYFLPAGTSLGDTDRVARKIDHVLATTPEVVAFSRRTGAELGPATATQVNRGDIMVRLAPRGERERDIEAVIAEVRDRLGEAVPEARTEYVQVLQDVLNDLAGNPRPIEIRVFGDDATILRRIAKSISDKLADVDGLVDLDPGFEGFTPELRLDVDPLAAARLGRSPDELADRVSVALRGEVVGTLRRPGRPVGVRVRYPDAVRFDRAHILDLPLIVPSGAGDTRRTTRLGAILRPPGDAPAASAVALEREGQRAVIVVSADHEERDLGAIERDIEARLADVAVPPGYRVEIGGQLVSERRTVREIATVMGFGILAVLLVLLVQFRRARLALVVILTVPLSVVGALLVLWATGIALNASSLMGCVLLVGLVVKNGILLLEQLERHLERGLAPVDALLAAGRSRIRPIAMTTFATVAGLAPLALGLGAGAEIQRPLAVSVVGGLVLATLASLVVLPALARLVVRRGAPSETVNP